MNRKFPTFIIILLWFFVSPVMVNAEIHIADSLEWMTIDSTLIVQGVVVDVVRTPHPAETSPELAIEDVTVRITDVLKGDYSEDNVNIRRLSYSKTHSTALSWKEANANYLFFLKKGEGELHGVDLNGYWTPRSDFPYGPIDLSNPSSSALYIVSASMEAPKDGDRILQIVRDTIDNKNGIAFLSSEIVDGWEVPDGAMVVNVPEDSEAFKTLWSGSSCYMVVPDID